MHAQVRSAEYAARAVGCLQLLIARHIFNFELVAVAPLRMNCAPWLTRQRVQGGDIRPDGSRGNRQSLRQLILRQRSRFATGRKLRQTLVRNRTVVVLLRLKVK